MFQAWFLIKFNISIFVILLFCPPLSGKFNSATYTANAAIAIATDQATVIIPESNLTKTFTPTLTPQNTPEIIKYKYVKNETKHGATTKNNPAQAGDEIHYRLIAINDSNSDYYNYRIKDNIGDILNYADVIDGDHGWKLNGIEITFPAVTIKAHSEISRSFWIKILDPIPYSKNEPCYMENSFGNTVRVYLDCRKTPTKTHTPKITDTPTPTKTYTPIPTATRYYIPRTGTNLSSGLGLFSGFATMATLFGFGWLLVRGKRFFN